jgi:hypothetical protein
MMDLDDAYMNRIARMQYPGDLEAEAQGEAMGLEQAAQQALVGTLPQDTTNITAKQFGKMAMDVPAALLKGGVQGTIGLPGDLISLGKGIAAAIRPNAGEGRVDAFLRGMEGKTLFPTTEDVRDFLDRTLGPVVPESETDEARRKAAAVPEFIGELGGGGKTIVEGAKAAGTVAAAGAKFAAPKVGEMLDSYMRRTGMTMNIAPINPSDFNPAQEIKIAVDAIQSDPKKVIYLPQAERAPAVALRITQPKVVGTGDRGVVTVADVGSVLEKSQVEFNGGKVLDPTNPQDLSKMIDSASAEAEFQLSQPISGATWYEDDVSKAFELSSKIVPQLATDEDLRVLTTAFAASTSYNKRAGDNWAVATKIADHLMKTGTVAARNPDNGKLWGGTTGPIMEQQLKLHEYMINKMGIDKYAEWLLTPHTVKEIAAMKMESGLYKSPGVPGKANDMKMGSFIIGEKGGAFFLNLNGIKETTADKWFSRTYNRHTGTLTSGQLSEQGVVDKPRNEGERALMKTWNRAVADNVKLNEQANQAVLWYFEQNLYYNLGVKAAKSESFSDGAKNLLNARGIPFDDVAQPGAAGGSNAPQVGGKPQSATAAGNPVSSGAVAATQSTTPSNVKRGKGAPQSGAQ